MKIKDRGDRVTTTWDGSSEERLAMVRAYFGARLHFRRDEGAWKRGKGCWTGKSVVVGEGAMALCLVNLSYS